MAGRHVKGFLRSGRRRPINLSRGAFRQMAAALGLAVLAGAAVARADWTLLAADQSEKQHLTINSWTPAEGLSVRNGKLVTMPTREVVALSSGREVVANPDAREWKLTLRNGDVFYGKAVTVSGQSLVFKVTELGEITVPLKYAAKLSAPVIVADAKAGGGTGVPEMAVAADHDVLVFKENGDRLEGLFNKVDGENVQFVTQTAGAGGRGAAAEVATDVPLGRIQSITFGGVKAPRTVPPLSVRLTFQSGSVLTVPLAEGGGAEGDENAKKGPFSWTLDQLWLRDPGGMVRSAQEAMVVNVEVLGGRVVYLTELDPVKEEQVSFFGTKWPAQVNRNVMGSPLKVARAIYPRGVGVHTQSMLVYELDGSFDTFSIRVGLDDSAAPHGEAKARIVLDGKTLWESAVLKPGELSEQLSLPVKGGRKLELHADPATKLDVLGRVDWIDAALFRK